MRKYTFSTRHTGPALSPEKSCIADLTHKYTNTWHSLHWWTSEGSSCFTKCYPSAEQPRRETHARLTNPGCSSSPCKSSLKVHGEKDTHRDVDAASFQLAEPVENWWAGRPCSSLTPWAPCSPGGGQHTASSPHAPRTTEARETIFGRGRGGSYTEGTVKRGRKHTLTLFSKNKHHKFKLANSWNDYQ